MRESLSRHQVAQPTGDIPAAATGQPNVGAVNVVANTFRDDGSTLNGIYLLIMPPPPAGGQPPTDDEIKQGTYVDPSIRDADGDWTYDGLPGAVHDSAHSPTPNVLYSLADWTNSFGQSDPERHEKAFRVTGITEPQLVPARPECYGVEIDHDRWLFPVYSMGNPHVGFRLMISPGTPLKARQIDVAAVSVGWTADSPFGSTQITYFDGIGSASSSLRFPLITKPGAILIYQVPTRVYAWPVTSGQFEAPRAIKLQSQHVPIYMSVNLPPYPWNSSPHFSCVGGYTLCIKKLDG